MRGFEEVFGCVRWRKGVCEGARECADESGAVHGCFGLRVARRSHLRRLGELLGDDVLLDAELVPVDLVLDVAQVGADLRDDLVARLAREDKVEHDDGQSKKRP